MYFYNFFVTSDHSTIYQSTQILLYISTYKSGIGQLWLDLDSVGRGPGVGHGAGVGLGAGVEHRAGVAHPKHLYQHGLGPQSCPEVQ